MRFRKLNFEELTSLEKEFKEFLIINHIHDEEWRDLNKEAPEKVSALLEVFSDTVLLKVYGKISYLEFYGEDIWSFFKIDKEWINSIHIQVNNSRDDLPKQIHEILTDIVYCMSFQNLHTKCHFLSMAILLLYLVSFSFEIKTTQCFF